LALTSDWPIAAWVVLLAVAVFVGEYVWLRVQQQRSRAAAEDAERRLARFATALRNYAADNLQTLPRTLDELNLPESSAVAYRPVPRLNLDDKLILLHDAGPVHKVLEFPVLRDGRGVVFCNGRLHIVSEEIYQKLLVADDALRDRLKLDPIEQGG